MSEGLLAELNRMKVMFQARTIAAVMGFPAQAISTGTVKTPTAAEGKACERGADKACAQPIEKEV